MKQIKMKDLLKEESDKTPKEQLMNIISDLNTLATISDQDNIIPQLNLG